MISKCLATTYSDEVEIRPQCRQFNLWYKRYELRLSNLCTTPTSNCDECVRLCKIAGSREFCGFKFIIKQKRTIYPNEPDVIFQVLGVIIFVNDQLICFEFLLESTDNIKPIFSPNDPNTNWLQPEMNTITTIKDIKYDE